MINNEAGRALRNRAAPVRAADVLNCSGDFCAGDSVYIAFRTGDGSQYVVATGTVQCDADLLRQACSSGRGKADSSSHRGSDIVVLEQDVRLLWPPKR